MFEFKRPKETRNCCVCGREYRPMTNNQKYCYRCCDAAYLKRRREYAREYRRTHLESVKRKERLYHKATYVRKPEHDYKDCAVCGAPFVPYTITTSLYCSEMCRRIAENEHQRIRRAKKREATA